MSILKKTDRKEEPETRTPSPYRPRSWRRYLWEFLLYFLRPIVIWWIVGYFGWQSVKSIASAVSSYERTKVREEIKARKGMTETEQGKQDKQKRKERRRSESNLIREVQ